MMIIILIKSLITMIIPAGPPSSQQEPSFATLRSLITSRPNPRFFNDDPDCDDRDYDDNDYDDHDYDDRDYDDSDYDDHDYDDRDYDDDHDCDADEHVLTDSLHRWRAQASPGNHLDQVAYDYYDCYYDFYDCYDDP